MAASDLHSLKGKVAIVTGASRRIGRATALGLAQMGASVVVTARNAKEEIEIVAKEIRDGGGQSLPLLVDITNESSVKQMADATIEQFGRIDILVNNAAIRRQAPFMEMSAKDWREIMSVILDGAFFCSRAVLPHMVEGGGGTIVNIGGVSAHTGVFNRAHVATAKAGIVGLTRALAVEFADRGITVNCVAPGKIGGKRSATAGASPPLPGEERLQRPGTIEEAAAVICFMCSPAAAFMNGQTVHVSGGMFMP